MLPYLASAKTIIFIKHAHLGLVYSSVVEHLSNMDGDFGFEFYHTRQHGYKQLLKQRL